MSVCAIYYCKQGHMIGKSISVKLIDRQAHQQECFQSLALQVFGKIPEARAIASKISKGSAYKPLLLSKKIGAIGPQKPDTIDILIF